MVVFSCFWRLSPQLRLISARMRGVLVPSPPATHSDKLLREPFLAKALRGPKVDEASSTREVELHSPGRDRAHTKRTPRLPAKLRQWQPRFPVFSCRVWGLFECCVSWCLRGSPQCARTLLEPPRRSAKVAPCGFFTDALRSSACSLRLPRPRRPGASHKTLAQRWVLSPGRAGQAPRRRDGHGLSKRRIR